VKYKELRNPDWLSTDIGLELKLSGRELGINFKLAWK
jgi:hypothetical protein